MAVIRQLHVLGQLRIDVPDLRAIESGVAHDFDVLAGYIFAGTAPQFIRGFTIATTSTLGTSADLLQLATASGLLLHFGSSAAGTIYQVPSDQDAEVLSATNSAVTGSFAAGTTNYVGIDVRRTADDSTADTSRFIDADTELEISRTVPKGRTLSYQIIITTQPFSATSNVAPIAKVVTDVNNNVVSVTDARPMMFRLGSGGDTPDPEHSYTWADTDRKENAITYASGSLSNPFAGGDKEIVSFKDWMDALMMRLWELGSGESWYSPVSRDNVKLIYGPIVSLTDNFEWDLGSDTLTWESLSVAFENSTAYFNTITDDDAELDADGKCLYIDIDRSDDSTPLVAQVGDLLTLGSPAVAGSRFILAWRVDDEIHTRDRAYEIGRTFAVATTSSEGVVRLNATPASAGNPAVVAIQANGTASVTASAGNTAGFTGTGKGTGAGLVGNAESGTAADGVRGVGQTTGRGGYFEGGSGGGAGVYGKGIGTNGNGVYGEPHGTGAGVKGASASSSGYGVWGLNTDAGVGVYGSSSGEDSAGVYGASSGDDSIGVRGVVTSGEGYGVFGSVVVDGYGVRGEGGTGGYGGYFLGGTIGGTALVGHALAGNSTGVRGIGSATNGIGVHGSGSGSGPGVLGEGAAAGTGPGGNFTALSATANTNTRFGAEIGSGGAAGHLKMSGGNPTVTTAFTNVLTPANVAKAWCVLKTDGTTVTVAAGFNITSVTITGGDTLVVTMASACTDSGVNADGGGDIFSYVPSASVFSTGGSFVTAAYPAYSMVSSTVFHVQFESHDGSVIALGDSEIDEVVGITVHGLH